MSPGDHVARLPDGLQGEICPAPGDPAKPHFDLHVTGDRVIPSYRVDTPDGDLWVSRAVLRKVEPTLRGDQLALCLVPPRGRP